MSQGTLHWFWIKLLAACKHGSIAALPLRAFGAARWLASPVQRRKIQKQYLQLQKSALSAGCSGHLTGDSAGRITLQHYMQRPFFGAAPALAASAGDSFIKSFYETHGKVAAIHDAARNGGAVIVGTHMGSLGITPALLVRQGVRVIILRDQQFAPILNTRHGTQFFLGAEPVFLDIKQPASVNKAMIRCAKALRQGAVIAYTADARHGSHYHTGEVFGKPVQVRVALVELAMRCNSAVFSAFSYYQNGKVHLDISEAQWPKSAEDLEGWCDQFCSQWQQHILSHPSALSWHVSDFDLIIDCGKK